MAGKKMQQGFCALVNKTVLNTFLAEPGREMVLEFSIGIMSENSVYIIEPFP